MMKFMHPEFWTQGWHDGSDGTV